MTTVQSHTEGMRRNVEPQSSGRTLAILGFHKIGAPPPGTWETWFYVPEATFIRFLSQLREGDWRVINLHTLMENLTTPENLPARSVMLTFDDGYLSMRETAVPHLRRFGYPAVLFVPSDFIGRHNEFDAGVEPDEPICDWNDLRDLERQGISIQSHGASHRRFSQLAPSELEQDLFLSKAALEEGLGRPVETIAYPYGDGGTDPQSTQKALERAGYRAACLYGGGPQALPITNPYFLSRLPMGPDTDLNAALETK
jgi:peptidoglycan/xylan/chitin deacetylase (PgdA/CDA1 family)